MPSGRWATSDTWEGRIYRAPSSAGLGQPYDPALLQATDVGSYRFRFTGNGRVFEYAIDNRPGTLNLQRQGF